MTEILIPVLDTLKHVPISLPTLRRWTRSGKLETLRAGSKVFTSREAIARMLRPGTEPTPPRGPACLRDPARANRLAQVDQDLELLFRPAKPAKTNKAA